MLMIRKEQMRAFEENLLRQFEWQMVRYLRSSFAAQVGPMSDEELSFFIRRGITKSEQYGIANSGDISRYVGYMVTYGPDFDTAPWAANILSTPRINGTQKMDRIDNY